MIALQPTHIIKRPLITEKSTWEGTSRNRFSFEVDLRANKTQIKDAIQSIYNVRVVGVATQVRKGEIVRTRFGEKQETSWKKAVVELHPDDKLELF
ncbi:MAG: 50S ribosomal protein L23 [Phycisphaeraceae bacterium]|nr:50S ribosomal protein L23 [Phycisphaeraceae bacterium]